MEVYGDPAKVFVHEWAKFRYGIFDEFGFSGDDLYPNYYKVDGQMVPTGSSDLLIKGAWLKQGVPCDPSDGQEGPQVIIKTSKITSDTLLLTLVSQIFFSCSVYRKSLHT